MSYGEVSVETELHFTFDIRCGGNVLKVRLANFITGRSPKFVKIPQSLKKLMFGFHPMNRRFVCVIAQWSWFCKEFFIKCKHSAKYWNRNTLNTCSVLGSLAAYFSRWISFESPCDISDPACFRCQLLLDKQALRRLTPATICVKWKSSSISQ